MPRKIEIDMIKINFTNPMKDTGKFDYFVPLYPPDICAFIDFM